MKVAFLGPRGTYAEQALRVLVPGAAEVEPRPTVYETVMSVHDGAADRAVVPIENSLEGSVAATLDTLAVDAPDVRIVAETAFAIRHCLIAREPLRWDAIERVVSHPQALAQCAHFLRRELPGVELAGAPSTADGVRQVAASAQPLAAIASRAAAEAYGCHILAEGIEDGPENVTRFVCVARAPSGPAPGDRAVEHKTSIVFWGFNDVSPGALVAVLDELARRAVNLTKIESRPRRVGLGHYMFFADLEGPEHDPRLAEALAALALRVETLRVLGSYPTLGTHPPR